MKKTNKPLIYGLIASTLLLSIYFGVLTIAESFNHAIEQFYEMWYWILMLAVGFGFQFGLYFHIREFKRAQKTGAKAEIATASGISTGSMIACCAHHVTDVLPILGLSAAALFLAEYQVPFMVLGVFSNLVGITMMLNIIQKHKLFNKRSWLNFLSKYNMRIIRNAAAVFSLFVVSSAFITTALLSEPIVIGSVNEIIENEGITLLKKTNSENGVSIDVQPVDFSFDMPLKFNVGLNTHQGDLDFDVSKISILEDDKGNEYTPLEWEGSAPGGHHRSGTLTFSKLNGETTYIKLIIKDVYGVSERVFIWEL
jgi:hypothetical protein